MAGGPFAANVQCSCLGVGDRFYEGVEDDIYLCRQCGKTFIVCWDREEELPKALFHPEVRAIKPPPLPPKSGPPAEP